MAKKNYLELNVKAAAITGAVFGFVWSLLAALTVSGMMDRMIPPIMGSSMMGYGAGVLVIILSTILWAIAFGFVAAAYNYALKTWGK